MSEEKKDLGSDYHAEHIVLGAGVVEWQEKNLEYKRYEYPIKEGDVVYDIGSFEGQFAAKFRAKGARVREFDPGLNYAAWIYDGTMMIGGGGNTRSAFTAADGIEVPCIDLNKFIRGDFWIGDGNIKLMKINIEGGEYALLSHLFSGGLLKRIEHLQIQFHLLSSLNCKLLYSVLSQQLSQTHALEWRYPFCWESWKLKEAKEKIEMPSDTTESLKSENN